MIKKLILLLILPVLLAWTSQAQTTFFTTKGKNIIGPDGKPFLLKGTNLGNWLVPEGYMFRFDKVNSPRLINTAFSELMGPEKAKVFWQKFIDNYITPDDIRYIKKTGANSIRIPFHYKLFTREDYMGSDDPQRGFRIFDRVLDWCRKENLYVILDMHCAPGGQTGDNIDDGYGYPFLFEDPASRQLLVKIWADIAARYRNDRVIIGYDVLNEPIAHYFDVAKLNPYLEPLYKEVVAAIRKTDKNHLVFLGGAQWDSNFKIFGKPFDDKLVYTFHKYWTAATVDVIRDYIDFSEKYQVPIYCGETGENTNEWVEQFRLVLEKNNIGWHYWPYKKLDNLRGFMSFDKPAGFDSVIAYTQKNRASFEDIRKAAPHNREALIQSLDGFLKACQFKYCKPNDGYIQALGLKP